MEGEMEREMEPPVGMEFSELVRHTGRLCAFSPDGAYLATCVGYRVVVRDAHTLQVAQLHSCLDCVSHIEWCPDSRFLLCAIYPRGLVQVFSMEHPDWRCKVDEGSAGLVASRWSPDGRHILNTSDFQLRITVWSLSSKAVSYIRYPKACAQGVDFTRDGRFMALAERRDGTDCVSIFSCSDWQLRQHFKVETEDLEGLAWSPSGSELCVWDSALQYGVCVYSWEGRPLCRLRAYSWALGVRCVAWNPAGSVLAVGSYDQKVRLLNHVTWQKVAEMVHTSSMNDPSVVVYRETERRVVSSRGGAATTGPSPPPVFHPHSRYEIAAAPVAVPVVKPDADRANPRVGVAHAAFSSDGRYLATVDDGMPRAIWLWELSSCRLLVLLLQAAPVLSVAWEPRGPRLALCTGSACAYLWTPAGSVCVAVPHAGRFRVLSVAWAAQGDALLLVGKERACVCYLRCLPGS
ncbi:WD repeat-containing protein WRAP73-like [Petromyzon marinus]|uniref:WD repeat-containing protein WRAP73-like n=1 Tax=Petromyzon marinus TaxID=7757 RepID=UPI003F7170FC